MAGPARIMVIEDEPLIAMGIQMMLEGLGHEVPAVVDCAADAVAAAARERFDLVLADVRLKGDEDGIHAVERILALQPVAVLFLTGNPDELRLRGFDHMPVLAKPFVPASLERALKRLLAPI
ncbi:response regulator [Magnetospirillum sp. UT-4]|uniref:response regulator n=1 Tax=Magnetospirillum sp. UT-4 TaxID=2681467 RepID=UPI00137E507A